MRLKYIANALGIILKYIGLMAVVPILIAICYVDYKSVIPFAFSSLKFL